MMIRRLKLFWFLFLLFHFTGFSQNGPDKNLKSIGDFNSWLKTVQLNRFFAADGVKVVKIETTVNDNENKSDQQFVATLILKSSGVYRDPAAMAGAWDALKQGFLAKGVDICQLLLDKWADYNASELRHAQVELRTDDPELFSCTISFNEKLKVREVNGTRGGVEDPPPAYDFQMALGSIIDGDYTLIADIPDLTKYGDNLEALFRNYRTRGGKITCKWEIRTANLLRLWVTNVYGQVTGENYHERLCLTINLIPIRRGQVEIRYNMDVFYAAGILLPPAGMKEFRDAALDYSSQLADYNVTFREQFKTIFK